MRTTCDTIRALALLSALLTGCAGVRETRPLFCKAPQLKEAPTPAWSHALEEHGGTAEVLLIEPRLRPPGPDAPESNDPEADHFIASAWFTRQAVSVRADGVPLFALATALGEALHVDVSLDAPVARARVVLRAGKVLVRDLLADLERAIEVKATWAFGTLRFETTWNAEAEYRSHVDYAPLKVRLLRFADEGRGREFAMTFCQSLSTERGSAVVLGHVVALKDVQTGLLRGLLAGAREGAFDPAPPPHPPTCTEAPCE